MVVHAVRGQLTFSLQIRQKLQLKLSCRLMAIDCLFSVVNAPKGIVSQGIQITPYVFQFKWKKKEKKKNKSVFEERESRVSFTS